jgi:hypothetical protein
LTGQPVYRVELGRQGVAASSAPILPPPDKPSIAVLPFQLAPSLVKLGRIDEAKAAATHVFISEQTALPEG